MSYVRFNDEHDGGQLTAFRERLSTEVRAQSGEAFPIFQDRNDIAWGQSWQERIDDALDAVTLLLVIITPGLFRSPACRAEITRFAERETALGRTDLIFPVYYIGAREMDDPDRRDADDLARLLHARQYADWRELRFEPVTSPHVRKAISRLAERMRDAFWQAGSAVAPNPSTGTGSPPAADRVQGPPTTAAAAKAEPPTHVVDPYHRGDFATIGEAITAARPGDRILVRPGLYDEALVVDKPLEILGEGEASEIVVQARNTNTLLFRANIGRVANLTFRQSGGERGCYGVDIGQGRLDVEGCDISSRSLACVAIRNGADPRLRGNRIHGGAESGVFVTEGGLGTLEDNDITANRSGVAVSEGGDPTLRRNHIHHNRENGIHIYENGHGTFEDNDITANLLAAVAVHKGGDPVVRGNRIHGSREGGGVFVYEDGRGTLEDNDITANNLAGVEVRTGGDPVLRRNHIRHNRGSGVFIHDRGRGTFEDNEISDNERGTWDISADSEDLAARTGNSE